MTISFAVSKTDMATISKIVERAQAAGLVRGPRKPGHWYGALTARMDLCAAHNDCGMDFDRLLAADDFNFLHDIAGIARHMDRETGRLGDCFLPRFARKQAA